MSYIWNNLHNSVLKFKKAIQFHQFTSKLLQIRMAETLAKVITSTRLYKAPVLPKDIVIRITEKCFLNCKFCAQGGESGRVDKKSRSGSEIEMKTIKKIIDEVSGWKIKPFIKITGGEPLVAGEPFLDLVQEMREKKIIVKLNTNGMLLKNRKIAKKIAETDVNYLSISLDGGRDVHNGLRGNPKLFDSIMEGIENVKEYRKTLNKKNLMILISMVVSSETQDQIEEVYRIAEEKQVDWFNIQFLNYTTTDTCEESYRHFQSWTETDDTFWKAFCNPRFNDIDPARIAMRIKNILSFRGKVPVSVMGGLSSMSEIKKYYFTLDAIRKNICVIPFTGMHIVPPGKAVFCIDYPFYDYGDIQTDSLKSVWYGEKATHFREDMIRFYRENKKNYPHCQRCNWRFN